MVSSRFLGIYIHSRDDDSEEELRMMLIGVGSRFDFHLCKVLCDLRY